MARIIRGNRGVDSKFLVHEGFRYHLNRTRNGSMYWRCWQKHCRSGIITNNFNLQNQNALIQVLRNNDTHCHLLEHGQVEELENINNVIRNSSRTSCSSQTNIQSHCGQGPSKCWCCWGRRSTNSGFPTCTLLS